MPATVVIGIAALRSTCRRTTWRDGMPRLTAVCTCSRPISLAHGRPASRARRSPRRQRERDRRQRQVPDAVGEALAGAERREPAQIDREDADISTIAATNDGTAANTVVSRRSPLSSRPGRSPASTPSPIPSSDDQQRRVQHELERDADALARSACATLLAQRDRAAEVAVQHDVEPMPVAHEERLVEVVALRAARPRSRAAACARRRASTADRPARGPATRRWRSSRRAAPPTSIASTAGDEPAHRSAAAAERGRPRAAHVRERGRGAGQVAVVTSTVFGAANGIHGSVSMIRSPAFATSSARRFGSAVVRASSSAAVIWSSSKP